VGSSLEPILWTSLLLCGETTGYILDQPTVNALPLWVWFRDGLSSNKVRLAATE